MVTTIYAQLREGGVLASLSLERDWSRGAHGPRGVDRGQLRPCAVDLGHQPHLTQAISSASTCEEPAARVVASGVLSGW